MRICEASRPARTPRAVATAVGSSRPPGGIDLDALYRENLIDGVVG
jgi:hypothetical protein